MKFTTAIISTIFIISAFIITGCKGKMSPALLFQLQENTNINFSNEVRDTKDFNILTYRNFYNGGGVAIGDINNDGLADVFFTSNMSGNKLYLNKGNFKFEDISSSAGIFHPDEWSTGVVMDDVNGDGS